MGETENIGSGPKAYISLHDAFTKLGKLMHPETWDGECVRLGRGSYDDLGAPRLYDPTKIEPEDLDKVHRADSEGVLSMANKNQCKCYFETLDVLTQNLWSEEIKAVGILKNGKPQKIERAVWLDQTGEYVISIFDSEIMYRSGKLRNEWSIKIEKDSIDTFTKHFNEPPADVLKASDLAIAEIVAQFPPLPNLKWKDITITFYQDNAVKIKAQNVEKKYTFAEMGFKDGRKGDAPNSRWALLRGGFAANGGAIKWEDNITLPEGERDKLKKMASDISRTIKTFFGLTESPFFRYHKSRGYKLKFSLLDQRFTSDQEPATSRTDLYAEYNENELDAQANQWLEGDDGNRRIGNLSNKNKF